MSIKEIKTTLKVFLHQLPIRICRSLKLIWSLCACHEKLIVWLWEDIHLILIKLTLSKPNFLCLHDLRMWISLELFITPKFWILTVQFRSQDHNYVQPFLSFAFLLGTGLIQNPEQFFRAFQGSTKPLFKDSYFSNIKFPFALSIYERFEVSFHQWSSFSTFDKNSHPTENIM